jgi:hypothetical protein
VVGVWATGERLAGAPAGCSATSGDGWHQMIAPVTDQKLECNQWSLHSTFLIYLLVLGELVVVLIQSVAAECFVVVVDQKEKTARSKCASSRTSPFPLVIMKKDTMVVM